MDHSSGGYTVHVPIYVWCVHAQAGKEGFVALERTDQSVTLCPQAVVDKYPGSQSIWRAEKIDESALYKGFDNCVICYL